MKNIFFIGVATCLYFSSQAQKIFDSASYIAFYETKWERINFDTSAKTRVPLNENERIAGLSKCWSEAKYNFANFDLIPTLNWDSLYLAFIPKVMKAKNNNNYYKVLQNFYSHLHDGHSGVTSPEIFSYNAAFPIDVRWIENKAIVTKVKSAGADWKDVKPGDELIVFQNQPVKDYVSTNVSPFLSYSTPQDSIERIYRYELFFGREGSASQMTFKNEKGKETSKVFTREKVASLWNPEKLLGYRVLPGNIGYLQLLSFNSDKIVAQFDSLFPQIEKTKALIIDLRDNGGGNGNNGFEIIGNLSDKPFYTGKQAIRYYRPVGRSWGSVEKIDITGDDWKPYKNKLYDKPVALLIGGATYSAAEDFISAFKSINRGKIFGTPSGGSTGQPVMFNLPGGGFGRVCAKRDFAVNGVEFVGIGFQPDILVDQTIKSIRAGKDDVLEAAIRSFNF
jgi:C-terminal processing protease CtpA/Prc